MLELTSEMVQPMRSLPGAKAQNVLGFYYACFNKRINLLLILRVT